MHLRQVGVVAAGLRRGAGADEVDIAERRGLRVGSREGQPPGVQAGLEELAKPGLVEGQLPGVQLAHPPGVAPRLPARS